MTIYGVRQRVACYVTRTVDGAHQLLVVQPLADDEAQTVGVRVPSGAMASFETVEAAAAREVAEQSGLVDLRFEGQVGAVERGLHDAGGPSVTTFVHLVAGSDTSEQWEHTGSGTGDDGTFSYRVRWEPLPLTVELADGQAAYLDRL